MISLNAPQYAKDLELRARRAEARADAWQEGIGWLRSYLNSDKFRRALPDGTLDIDAMRVNVEDVLARLSDVEGHSLDREAQVS